VKAPFELNTQPHVLVINSAIAMPISQFIVIPYILKHIMQPERLFISISVA
jgi:hypothetical protein